MKKQLFDLKSIHFKLLVYFMLFAMLIIALIGGMEIFLFNNFYGTMKARDTGNLAGSIRTAFARESESHELEIS